MAEIPEDVAKLWASLDPSVKAALISSEEANGTNGGAPKKVGNHNQGRRAIQSDGPLMESKLIGGDCFAKREANPSWLKTRTEVYDAVKAKRDEELAAKVPVDIEVALPDGKVLSEDKVCGVDSFLGDTTAAPCETKEPDGSCSSNLASCNACDQRRGTSTSHGARPPST